MSQAAYEFHPEEPPSSTSTQSESESSTTEQVKEKAQQVVGQVQETATNAKEQVGDRLSRVVQERSSQTGEQAIRVAESLRQSVTSMREQGQDGPARLAEQAADRVQALGLYLRDNDGDRILADVEDFARRQPMIVAAGAFAVGLLGARFLKASSARRQATKQLTEPVSVERPTPPPAPTGTAIMPATEPPVDLGGPTTAGLGTVPPTTATP